MLSVIEIVMLSFKCYNDYTYVCSNHTLFTKNYLNYKSKN